MPESEIAETRNVTAAKSTSYCCTVKDDYGNEKDVYFYIHIGGVYSYPEGNEDTRKNRIAITAKKESSATAVATVGADGTVTAVKDKRSS